MHKRFEDLPVWQAAIRLAVAVFRFTESGEWRKKGDLCNQMERAALSISNNIAEGWERGPHEELLTFLYYARGSAGEVRSMIRVLEALVSPDQVDKHLELLELSLMTSRQLGAWIESIKDSPSKGPRYRNASARKAENLAQRQAGFQDILRSLQERARRPPETPSEPS